MGFWLQIQADNGSEVLRNIHPDGGIGGKAILAFLIGLSNYTHRLEDKSDDSAELSLSYVYDWFSRVETIMGKTFLPRCEALLESMWGNGGDPTEFREHEYAFFLHRNPSSRSMSESQFQELVRSNQARWQPIEDVLHGVELLLEMFRQPGIEPLEGFYAPEDTIPDFEALQFNIRLLKQRGNSVIRLNFF
jgi:hypothetical protein